MTRNTQKNHRSPDLGALLRAEHVQLDQTFEALAEGFRADPRSAGLIEWKRFEAALLAHLNVEEDLVLPTFQRSHPIEAAQLLDEHASIRRELDELGLGVELHLISVPLIERFISKLRAHAAREDAMLYEHLDAELAAETRERAIERVHDTSRRIGGAPPTTGATPSPASATSAAR